MGTFFLEGVIMLRVPVHCYSRIVGYYSEVKGWNNAKQEEFKNRKTYKLEVAIERMDIEDGRNKKSTSK